MTDREVEPHSSNSQKELPTILRFHVKHQLLGNNGETVKLIQLLGKYSRLLKTLTHMTVLWK